MQIFATNADSDTLSLMDGPAKSRRKVVSNGSVALLQESVQFGCASQDSHPRKSILQEAKLGSNLHRQILQGHVATHKKNSGKKGSIARRHSEV